MKKLVPSLLEYLKITEESNTDNENYNNVISPLAYSKMIKLGTEPIDPNGIFEYVVFLVRDKYNPRYPNDKLNWKFCIGGRRIAHKDVGNNWYLIGQELCLDNLNSKRIQDKIIFKKYTKYEFNKSFKEWYVTHQKYYFIDSNSEGTEEERIDTDCRQSGYKPEKRGANIKFVPDTSKESEIIISNMLEILKEANNIVLEFGSNPDSLFHSDKKINMQDIVKHRKGIDFGNEFEEKESSDIQKIISNSKRKKDYSKMSQKELEKEMNKAIDLNDLNTLKQIQPYLSESLKIFLKYDIRARCIYENMMFKRGLDPKESMDIGIIRREKFNINNNPDAQEMLSYLEEVGVTPIPSLESIFGSNIYYIGHSENDNTKVRQRIDVINKLIRRQKFDEEIDVSSPEQVMTIQTYNIGDLQFADLTEGVTSGWFTDAKGMRQILDLTHQ